MGNHEPQVHNPRNSDSEPCLNFTYDDDGRELTNGDGTFTYDSDGNMLTAANANGTYAFSYDPDDRLTNVSEPFGVTLSYGYDADGNQTEVIDSFGGTQMSTYDADGYLTQRTYSGEGQELRIDYVNDADGNRLTMTSYSDLAGTTLVATTDYAYNGAGQVTSIVSRNSIGALLNSDSYQYDSAGQLTQVVDNAMTTSYSYDAAGQLTSDGDTSYGYDANGNRDTGGSTVGTDNQITTDGVWDYTYNKEGDLVEKSSVAGDGYWIYSYNASNELTEAQEYNGEDALVVDEAYEYDAFGELIQTADGDVVTKYAVDGWNPNMPAGTGNANVNDWAILNSDNSLQTRNVFGNQPSQILARVDQSGASDPSGVYFDLTDRQGSVQMVIDGSGNIKDVLVYDGYGNITYEPPSGVAYRGWYAWTGQLTDLETDLQYNNARWYDPTMGRWMSDDPMGFAAGDSNLSRYVNNRPTEATDPSGLFGQSQANMVMSFINPKSINPDEEALKGNKTSQIQERAWSYSGRIWEKETVKAARAIPAEIINVAKKVYSGEIVKDACKAALKDVYQRITQGKYEEFNYYSGDKSAKKAFVSMNLKYNNNTGEFVASTCPL